MDSSPGVLRTLHSRLSPLADEPVCSAVIGFVLSLLGSILLFLPGGLTMFARESESTRRRAVCT